MIEIKYGVPVHCITYLTQLYCRQVRGVTLMAKCNTPKFGSAFYCSGDQCYSDS